MLQNIFLNKLMKISKPIRQFGGLVILTIIVIFSFAILNNIFGEGEELIAKMKKEEERIAETRKQNELISSLPSGILVFYDGTDHYKLSLEQYEKVCNATKIIPQRAIMGANFLNFRAHHIYTRLMEIKLTKHLLSGMKKDNKCFAGFTVSGNNVGVDEKIVC